MRVYLAYWTMHDLVILFISEITQICFDLDNIFITFFFSFCNASENVTPYKGYLYNNNHTESQSLHFILINITRPIQA